MKILKDIKFNTYLPFVQMLNENQMSLSVESWGEDFPKIVAQAAWNIDEISTERYIAMQRFISHIVGEHENSDEFEEAIRLILKI